MLYSGYHSFTSWKILKYLFRESGVVSWQHLMYNKDVKWQTNIRSLFRSRLYSFTTKIHENVIDKYTNNMEKCFVNGSVRSLPIYRLYGKEHNYAIQFILKPRKDKIKNKNYFTNNYIIQRSLNTSHKTT